MAFCQWQTAVDQLLAASSNGTSTNGLTDDALPDFASRNMMLWCLYNNNMVVMEVWFIAFMVAAGPLPIPRR